MPTKKVILCVDSLESGGAQRQIIVLANVLHARGYDVAILTYYPGDQLSQFLDSPAITRHYIPRHSRYDIGFLFRLRRFFRMQAPDCLISYLTTTNFWARTAGRLAGIPNIITSERSLFMRPGRLTALRERLLAPLSSAIVVNSRQAQLNLGAIGIPQERIRVIYNGLDGSLFTRQPAARSAALRDTLGVSPTDFLVLLPGRLSDEKNHILLVEAILLLDPVLRGIRVVFAGNEFYADVKQRLVARINAAGLSDRFMFLGPRTDMPDLYTAADVVVLPSKWEGFPNVIVEAMACGTPVIASDISDNPLIIEHGETGFLFPTNDAAKLAAAVNQLLCMDKTHRLIMGYRAAERARNLCSLEAFGDRYCALIEQVPELDKRAPAAAAH